MIISEIIKELEKFKGDKECAIRFGHGWSDIESITENDGKIEIVSTIK